jgi:hypothetical protein
MAEIKEILKNKKKLKEIAQQAFSKADSDNSGFLEK